MRDGGRISAAIEILGDLEVRRRPVQDALKDWGLTHRFAGSKDRNAIGGLVYDVLRRRASLAAIMGAETPRALVFAAYALMWRRGLEGLVAACDPEDRHAPKAPDADEAQRLSAGMIPEEAPDHVRADLPEWLMPSFRRVFGEGVVGEGQALASRAGVDLRVNTLKATREEVLGLLEGLGAAATPWSPIGLRIAAGEGDEKAPHVVSELAYKRGLYEIQDEGSQIASLIAAAGGAKTVVDLCAGGGGKSLALAAALGPAARIHAYDNDKRRFGDILDRVARAGADSIAIVEPGAGDPLARLDGTADLVIVDAPCTGTGTWRRRPDAKWRLAPGALDMRVRQQAEVLDRAARLVRPGGRICYVTCSLLPEENEDRIAAFVGGRQDFSVADASGIWKEATGTELPDGIAVKVGGGRALRLTPRRTDTDGFFIAVLHRRG
ncbi:RsmB/NOP family class I SAM-dependent RNA methyltransferase [Methylobrevis pamukkalensis]|uniref:Ribosomal RNA small subunit methyltransferase B n=1 Tax=Methylobrevis pamukkalensis TaxID=1439726 RepID=A0A1E3H1F6_9HYPH|nr:RsmB/NOP family class I SAM-dependent RNA methyltransferase [Methylobrevis pamukkalensis]ODN70150.1 Ribosomal RNA small subunit methyltransferase B [Methylobrevis pamukkalensis]